MQSLQNSMRHEPQQKCLLSYIATYSVHLINWSIKPMNRTSTGKYSTTNDRMEYSDCYECRMEHLLLPKSILQAATDHKDHLHQHAIIPIVYSSVSKTG